MTINDIPGLTTYKVTVHPSEVTVTVLAPSSEDAARRAVLHVDGVYLSPFLAQQFTTIQVVA